MSTLLGVPNPTNATPAARPRHYLAQSTFRKFTLDEYHRMIEQCVLMDGEPCELLEGNLVHKIARGSPHDSALQALFKRLLRMATPGWGRARTIGNHASDGERTRA
jgi:hypothetical protein